LTVADVFVAAFGIGTQLLRQLLPLVTQLVSAALIVSAIQQDTVVSVSHDWLTKPISRLDVVLAKAAFIALTVLVPIALTRAAVYAAQGYSADEAFLTALALDPIWFLLALPLVIAVAVVTPTLLQAIAGLVGLFVLIFLVPTFLTWLGVPMIDESIAVAGLMWIVLLPITVGVLGMLAAIIWLGYGRRRTRAARATLAIVPVALLVAAMLIGWPQMFAVQKALASRPAPGDPLEIALTPGCLPAESVDGLLAAGPMSASQARFVGAGVWSNDELERMQRAGPHAIAFAAAIAPRNLEEGWRLQIAHVDARYVDAHGNTLERALGATYRPSDLMTLDGGLASAHFWSLPGAAVERLQNEPTAKLELDYALSLLEPSVVELAADGKRRHVPALGYCAATRDRASGTIEVDCFKRGAQPALMKADIPGAPLRTAEWPYPDYTPAFLGNPLMGRRYTLTLQVPAGVDPAEIQLTAYQARSHFDRRVEATPGVLGGSAEACPVPKSVPVRDPIERSVWRDTSPHTTLFVNVADGVRLEVLDWGGSGRPLVLLHGLGASAHSFDDFAPKLASRYHVYGITRRGVGASTRAETGYDVSTLAQDVVRVLDALELDRSVVVAGHSIAGIELDELGAKHSDRIAGLVYLDAAADRTLKPSAEFKALMRARPDPPPPEPADLASYQAILAYTRRLGGVGLPQGEILATFALTPSGSVGGRTFDPRILDAIEDGAPKPDYAAFTVPALAINAIPRGPEDLMKPWYDKADPAVARSVQREYEFTVAARAAMKRSFLQGVARSRAVDLLGAKHFVFVSNEAEVLAEIDAFVAQLP
ncbi:MAG TPA: alpha/beta fold hydrolase, partial [Gammaproteobacteria bacterium]|nr:alpha/beta fold hydrolase [Gammaproteobacteria bacterium]